MNGNNKHKHTGLVRVTFNLDEKAWHGFSTERVWAELVADGRYRLRNSPFYAYGVSFEDIVFVKPAADGTLVFSSVSIRSGHSTYRIFAKHNIKSKEFNQCWQPLQTLGCSFEQATEHYLSVDVPSRVDIYQAYTLLQSGESAGAWDFEEGHCGHLLSEQTRSHIL